MEIKRTLLTRAWTMLLLSFTAITMAAQTVTVNVTQVGGLWDALEAQNVTNFSAIKSLKITGVMGESDFLLIKNQMSNLESIDISGTNVTEIPNKTFYQKEKLTTVRLPEDITRINSEAFSYCYQLTSVTFGSQSSVTGKIVFPSTLRYVDWDAFRDCQKITRLDFSACTVLDGLSNNTFQNLYGLQEVLFPSHGNIRLEWYCFEVDGYWDDAAQQHIFRGLESLTLTKAISYLSGYSIPRTLKTLYVESSTPPECAEDAFNHYFESENISLKIYIPKGSKRNYAVANGWSRMYPYMQEMGILLNVNGYGSVQQGNRSYTDGDVIFVNTDGSTTLKAVPEVGCELISVKLNGNAVNVAADGGFTIPAGTTVGTLDIAYTANPITVNNLNGGELRDNIIAMGSNPNAIQALKVVGTMTTKDWNYVKNVLTALADFDLSETDVENIPEYIFQDNQKIKAVHLPSTVVTIDRFAFQNCKNLTTVDGCENVEELRERAFQNCSKLTNFPFGDKLRSIESAVFENCTSLPESLVMPASLNSFGWDYMFNGSSVRSFDLSQCTLNSSFGWNAFGKCTSLLLPEKGDYTLGDYALTEAQLTELRLPAAVSQIWGESILPSTLKHLYVSRTTPCGVSDNAFNNIVFDNCTLYVPAGSSEDYEYTSNWSNFHNIKELGFKISISGFGVVQQGNIAYSNGDVYMPSQGSITTLMAVPEQNCQLLSVKINGNDVNVAADGAFTLPEGAATGTIDVAFSINQTVVDNSNGGELKDKITAMGISPSKVRALKVIGKMTTKDWNFVMSSLTDIGEFDISETDVTTIPESALREKEKLTTVHLPTTVTTIGNYAFFHCYQLTTVDGCENVKEIHERAFSNCKLAAFPFGNRLVSIGSGAFEGCSSLPESLVMPASLNSLGWDNVFNGSSIRSFDLSQCTMSGDFGYNTFGQCTSLLLPEKGDYRLAYQALKDAQLKELYLPAALSYLFEEDVLPTSLEKLYVSRSTPIDVGGNNTFRNIDVDNCRLFVPVGSFEAYSEANGWFLFSNVQEYGFKVKTNGFGVVRFEDKNYKDGETIFSSQASTFTMQVVPSSGYEIATLKVGGMALDYADDGSFTVPAAITGGVVEVTFTQKQLQLAISVEGNGSYTINGNTFTADTTLPMEGGDIVKLQLQPATGSFVQQVTINGEDAVLKNGGLEITTDALDANTNVNITFSNDELGVATVTFQQEGFGTVSYGGVTFEDGSTLTLVKGKSVTLTFEPYGDSDFRLLMVNGTDVTADVSAGSYTLSNVSANTTLKTTFFSPNMITIANLDGGGLKDVIAAMGSNARTIRALKVVGKMNTKDWNYVKNNMTSLEMFDISETDVKTIPDDLFRSHQNIQNVYLPSTVITIGNNAFVDCPQLITVYGCESVKEIGEYAFESCRKLSNFPFGNNLQRLGNATFRNCTSLPETLVMPASLYDIGWWATFSGSSVRSFDLSQCELRCQFHDNTFGEVTSLTLPEKGEYQMYDRALKDAPLTELRLPAAVSYIGGEDVLPTTLERLYVSRTEPFGIGDDRSLRSIDTDQCTLYVPMGSKNAYAEAEYWSDFSKVKEYGMQVTVGEQGRVRADAQTLMGKTMFFPKGSTATFDIVPNAGWHADAVTLDGVDIPFANNQFTLNGDQLGGKLAVAFAANQFNLQLQIAGNGQAKLGSLVYTANQTLTVDSLATLNFTLEPAEGNVVSAISFNGMESVVQNGGTTYVTPAIIANATLAITFGTAGATGDFATYNVSTGEGGIVEYKNTTLLPETSILLPKGQDAVFAIKPEQYCAVDVVKLNGKSVISELDADGNLTIKDVDADARLEVAFRLMSEIAVVMEDGGNLTNMLTSAQKENVTKLIVKGPIWEQDFYTMRDEMPQLSEIDLWEAETEYIPYQAFCTTADWWSNSVGKRSLTSVRLPENTHRIGGFAFAGCNNLTEVNFAELTQLEGFEGRTFAQTSLRVIDLSNTKITELGGEFYQVKNLENIKFPQSLTRLGDTFYQSSLTEIDLSECTNLNTLDNTFYQCGNLVKVTLPEGLITITNNAFSDCTSLTTVNFPSSLQNIGGWTFNNTKLQKIDLSGLTDLQSIGEYAFNNCKELTEVSLPEGLTSLNTSTFNDCTSLTTINFPSGLQNIGGWTFNNTKLQKIDLSGLTDLQSIGEYAFNNCKELIEVSLPEGLTAINNSVFSDCNSLSVINFPSSLQNIGDRAFAYTKLQKLDLSGMQQLTRIGNDAFQGCEGLTEVLFPSSLEQLGSSVFSYCHNLTSIDLSKTQLQNIQERAFVECYSLESVKMPQTLVTIGKEAFGWNYKLSGVLELGPDFKSIDERAFESTQITIIKSEAIVPPTLSGNSMSESWYAAFVPEGYADTYKDAAVWEDKIILDKEVHAEVTVSNEGNLAVDIYQQKGVSPATVTHLKVHGPLGPQDFAVIRSNMTVLFDLDIEDAEVSVIPENAILDKKVLTNVKLPASLLRIEHDAFRGCSSLKGSLKLPDGLKFIGWAAFEGCNSLEEVVINENLEVIQGYAFEGCSSLAQEITLPRDFQSLGERAFANCSRLYGTVKFNRDFYMFMGSEEYGSSAGACFENCSKIETVDMSQPDFLDEIPYRTFAGCTSLKTVLLPPTLDRIDNEAFIDCSSLDGIEFPSTLLVINWNAFRNCTSLRSVNLSDCKELGTIEGYAFYGCSSLETVYLPKNLNWIREYAFAECRKLANLTVEALKPADLGEYVFRRVHTDRCVLSIPTGTFEDYLSAAQWGEFVSMRKSIDVKVGEGANLFLMNNDSENVNYVSRRASGASQTGSKVKDGSSLYVQENESAIFKVNPDENVQIAKVLFNGQDVTNQMVNGTYETPGVTDASSFEVQVNVVGDIHVRELRMLDDDVAVKKGENRQLRYAVYPTNATNKSIEWTSSDESVATVNSDGIITGLAPGRAEITGKTIDGGFEQTCQIVIMSNNYWIVMDNTVENYVENSVTIPLALHNEGEARDIQFDVYMPSGVEMPDWYGNYGIQTTERTNGHSVAAAPMSDGGIRVIVYSQDGNQFQNSDGDLLWLQFNTGREVGNYDVDIRNIHVSGPNNFDFAVPNHTIHFSLKDYPLGDSNGSGDVSITDVANTVEKLLERYSDRFIQKAADANKDGQITIADVTATVDIILNRTNRAASYTERTNRSASQTTDKLFFNDFSITAGQQTTVELKMDNSVGYTAFQCDLYLPEGINVAKDDAGNMLLALTGRKTSSHVLSAEYINNGALRIVAYSIQNAAFNDSEEGVLSLTLEADEMAMLGTADIRLSDVRLINSSDRTEYLAPETNAYVNIGDPTSINFIAADQIKIGAEGREIIINSPKSMTTRLISLDGKSRTLQLKAGENRIFVETPGVYVISGKKFIIK